MLNLDRVQLRRAAEIIMGVQGAIAQAIPKELFEALSDSEEEAEDAFDKYEAEKALAELKAERMSHGPS